MQQLTCFVINMNVSYGIHDVGNKKLEQVVLISGLPANGLAHLIYCTRLTWYIIISNLVKALWNKGLSKIPQEFFNKLHFSLFILEYVEGKLFRNGRSQAK